MNKEQTLHAFWSGFGLPAFDETAVPDEKDRVAQYGQAFPYITYEVSSDSLGAPMIRNASLWYRSGSWAAITEKEQEIADYITRGGRMLAYDGGAMWIQKSTPWAQRMGDSSDDMIRRIVLSIIIEFLD